MLTVYLDERVSGVVMVLAPINHLILQHIIHFKRKGTMGVLPDLHPDNGQKL